MTHADVCTCANIPPWCSYCFEKLKQHVARLLGEEQPKPPEDSL